MSYLVLLFDVRADPVNPFSSGALLFALLVVIFVLAVGFTFGMVALLIWLKRHKAEEAELRSKLS
jgi:Tfp pilus assembly protein PilO